MISQTTSASYNPLSIAFDGTNYLAVWNRDIGPGYPNPQIWNVYGRLVSPSGTFVGNEAALATNQAVMPSLAFDGANYLLAWGYDLGTTNSNQTVRNRFFDRTASPIGSEFGLFGPQGTNVPLFAGALYGSNQGLVVATLGVLGISSGSVTGILSGDVYGTFIPKSTARPRLDVVGPLAGAQFPLQLTGTPGINYTIQMIMNLTVTNWVALVTNSPTNGTFIFTDTSATNKSRLYRAMKQ